MCEWGKSSPVATEVFATDTPNAIRTHRGLGWGQDKRECCAETILMHEWNSLTVLPRIIKWPESKG